MNSLTRARVSDPLGPSQPREERAVIPKNPRTNTGNFVIKISLKESWVALLASSLPTPVIIGDEAKAMEFSRKLLDEGVFVSAIVFPTVPKGTGRVRCMVTAEHTEEQLDRAAKMFEKVGKEMNILK